MRISGWQVPPGYLRWAAAGLGILLLSIAIATIASVLDAFGVATTPADTGRTVAATVATARPCDGVNAYEIVTLQQGGKDVSARFDGCGHLEGERVDVVLPPGTIRESTIVQSAGTAIGGGVRGQGLASVLLVGSGIAGAGYAFLVRRGPRNKALPQALRLAS